MGAVSEKPSSSVPAKPLNDVQYFSLVQEALDLSKDVKPDNNVLLETPPLPKAALEQV